MTKPAKTVLYGSAAAAALFALSILIRPQGLAVNHGLSYYGDFKGTIIPYSLAFFASAYSYWEAARYLKEKSGFKRQLARALQVMTILGIGLLVTPSSLVDPIHTVIGTVLFSFQLLLSMWVLFKYLKDWLTIVSVAAMWLSGLGALYYLSKPEGLLLQAQVVFQIAFWSLVIRTLAKLDD